MTNAEFDAARAAIAERLLEMTEADPDRWPGLVEHLPDLPPAQRDQAIARLEAIAAEKP